MKTKIIGILLLVSACLILSGCGKSCIMSVTAVHEPGFGEGGQELEGWEYGQELTVHAGDIFYDDCGSWKSSGDYPDGVIAKIVSIDENGVTVSFGGGGNESTVPYGITTDVRSLYTISDAGQIRYKVIFSDLPE